VPRCRRRLGDDVRPSRNLCFMAVHSTPVWILKGSVVESRDDQSGSASSSAG
jgi:hypothetical protein